MHQQGWSINTNPENSITFKKYFFSKGAKTMSFPIRKIGMPKMPKIAMLSTYHDRGEGRTLKQMQLVGQ